MALIVVILYQIFPMKVSLNIQRSKVMTLRSDLNSLYYSGFSSQELSLLKLLVLSELENYRGSCSLESSGNIHELLKQTQRKIRVLQSKQ